MKRRTLLAVGGATVITPALLSSRLAVAELKPVDDTHPAAKALAYVDDFADADPARYKEGQRCDNCTHYKADQAGEGRGGCALFPNFSVTAAGWCAGWVVMKS